MKSAAELPAAVTLVTTAETVAVVLPVLAEQLAGGGGLVVRGYFNFIAGTGTTAVVTRVRQGSTTGGTLVGAADTQSVTAGNTTEITFGQVIPAGSVPYGNQFCVTVQQTAATGNGTVNDGYIELDAITTGG